ncbi:MAG: FtsX-like permease family protein, partial [Bacteroidaceae bacterium]|nr:FtsX-like permease family protein [Bacteroidaceae bacterium]
MNYLTMFINRLFIRKREIALRMVFGATGRNIITQFLIEYGLLLAIAMVFGLVVINLSLEWFLKMTTLPHDTHYLYSEVLVYLLLVTAVSLLISFPCIWYFRRQSLQSSMTGVGALTRYYIFRRFSTGLQIAISIFCIFCTVVFMRQLNCLRSNKKGFEIESRMHWGCGYTNWSENNVELLHFLKQCPEVDIVFNTQTSYFPKMGGGLTELSPRIYPELKKETLILNEHISEDLIGFYGIQLVKGRWLEDADLERDENNNILFCNSILINESLANLMGWTEPLDHTLEEAKIVGIVKDVYNSSPTTPAEPTMYRFNPYDTDLRYMSYISIKYKPGMKQVLIDKVKAYAEKQGLEYTPRAWLDFEETYEKILQSERNLQKLLNITTFVCILIALFGVWSMIMLTCEQRRKEIAIRKVYGATTKDILDMFIIEYMSLQGVAALVAFPIGYACMKPWLEQYVVQTSIPWWI